MTRSLNVFLGGLPVGHLTEDERGIISFRILESYRNLPRRPVLSQSFEDDLFKVYRGRRGELPSFFANLVPEGSLRDLIESSFAIPHGDEMALLEAVGRDLPGAVEILPSSEMIDLPGEEPWMEGSETDSITREGESEALRFSLAGVQLKFSALRENEKLTLPAHGQHGEWIIKLDSSRFSGVVQNEFSTLEWARAVGFDVPECHLQSVESLPHGIRAYAGDCEQFLVIRRYDRKEGRRIHQEDFAQVVSQKPRLKYDFTTYEQCARLVKEIISSDAYLEFVRRLVFVVACGNNDAHLKNWSLVYPNGEAASLAPLYDQVCTISWPELAKALALKLADRKNFAQIDENAFADLATRVGANEEETVSVVHESISKVAMAWRNYNVQRLMRPEQVTAVRNHWSRVPLLRSQAEYLQ